MLKKHFVNREKERRDIKIITQVGLLMSLNNTLKKINHHGKQNQKSSRTRQRSS